MKITWIKTALVLAAMLTGVNAVAQTKPAAQGEFQPYSGQPGKDVVWVPTPESVVNKMLDLAKLTPQDFLVDLGSGDGRTVITAAKRGARAMGVEYNPDMVTISNREAAKAAVTDRVKFVNGDIFATDFSQANVLTLYLLPSLNMKLRPAILDLKPGTRVVSHAFNMGDWEPDETANIEGRQAFLWVVPAKLGGNWTLQFEGQTRELSFQQSFQQINGTIKSGNESATLTDGRVRGDEVRFTFTERGAKREFVGRFQANTLSGTLKTASQNGINWTATRR